jgi:hypothetical protein
VPPREKRRHVRVKAKGITAYLRLDAKTAGCIVEDISAGGLFIRTDRVVPVGTNISLDLVDPEVKKATTVQGQVVGLILKEAAQKRGVPQGLRIKFHRQAGATHEYLQQLLTRLGASLGDAPKAYAVTSAPPKPKAPTSNLPVVRRGPPVQEAPKQVRSGPPPVLYKQADGAPESTRMAPEEEDDAESSEQSEPSVTPQLAPRGLKGAPPPASAEDDGGPTDYDEYADAPEARTEIGRPLAEIEAEAEAGENDPGELLAKIEELEAVIAARDERIEELEAEVKALRLELAKSDDKTPVPARPSGKPSGAAPPRRR